MLVVTHHFGELFVAIYHGHKTKHLWVGFVLLSSRWKRQPIQQTQHGSWVPKRPSGQAQTPKPEPNNMLPKMRIKKLELRLHLSISKNLYLEISLSIPLAMQNHLPHGAASFLSLVAEVSDQRCNGCCEQFLSCQWMTSRSKTTVSKINYWIFLEFAYLPLLEFLRNPKMAMFNENIMVRLNCFARLQVAFQGAINGHPLVSWTIGKPTWRNIWKQYRLLEFSPL